jgi:hypothetical protein
MKAKEAKKLQNNKGFGHWFSTLEGKKKYLYFLVIVIEAGKKNTEMEVRI